MSLDHANVDKLKIAWWNFHRENPHIWKMVEQFLTNPLSAMKKIKSAN